MVHSLEAAVIQPTDDLTTAHVRLFTPIIGAVRLKPSLYVQHTNAIRPYKACYNSACNKLSEVFQKRLQNIDKTVSDD